MSGIEIMHRMPKQRHGFEFTTLFISYVGSGDFHENTDWEVILLGSDDTTEEGAKGRAFQEASKHIHTEDEAVIDADENNPTRPVNVAISTLDKGKAYKVTFSTRQFWV